MHRNQGERTTPTYDELAQRVRELEKAEAEWKRTEHALSLERHLYKDLVASQPAGVYRVRVKGGMVADDGGRGGKVWGLLKIELASDAFCRILGVPLVECEASTAVVADRIHPDDKPGFTRQNIEAANTLCPFKWEGRILKGGNVRWVQFMSVPRPLDDGDVIWTGILLDITERKQMEEALRESEARYRSLFEQAAYSIVVFDPRSTAFLEFNDAACRRLGYTREEFAGLRVSDVDVVESLQDVRRHGQRVITEGHEVFETRHRTKNGTLMDVEVWPRAINLNGKTVILAIWRDITARKRVEIRLRESEESLNALFNGSSEAILLLDTRGIVVRANPSMCERLGVTAEEFVGRSPFEFMPPDLAEARRKQFLAVIRDGKPLQVEEERNDRVMETHVYPTLGPSNQVTGVAVLVHDITTMKQAEERLKKVNEELETKVKARTARLRMLAAELTQAEHKERRRIALILHEDLQQRLVAAQYKVHGLKEPDGMEAVAPVADRLLGEIEECIQITRTLTSRLAPPVLYELGLGAVLDWLANDVRAQFGLEVRVTGRRSFRLVSDEMHGFAFDAIRELLLNASKHSGVREAEIRIRSVEERRVAIDVRDKGAGCAEIQKNTSSFGLFSIRERAQALGAEFDIVSVPGKGTCATLILPIL